MRGEFFWARCQGLIWSVCLVEERKSLLFNESSSFDLN